jgi:hypothetical protein
MELNVFLLKNVYLSKPESSKIIYINKILKKVMIVSV